MKSLTEELILRCHEILTQAGIPDGRLPRRIEMLLARCKDTTEQLAEAQAKIADLQDTLNLYVERDR